MKNHRDALKPDDEESNAKLWAVCDLAMGLIMQKTTSFEMKDYPTQPRIPSMYFRYLLKTKKKRCLTNYQHFIYLLGPMMILTL